MARYLVESRQKRLEREAREKREQEEHERRQKQKELVSLRRKYLKEQYDDKREPEPAEKRRRRGEPDMAARRKELIEAHQQWQEEDDEERFYVIEKLLDKRINMKGVEEYKVRWENYPPEADSWEPRSELEKNALDMILAFNNIPQPELNSMKHCICKKSYTPGKGAMIQCATCETWYHFSCLNLNLYEANCYADYNCNECRSKNPQLKCVVKIKKINKLQGLTRMTVDKNTGVILESPLSKKRKD